MNPILILTHNEIALTKKCVESARAQDIPTEILVWDNCSTDQTGDWLRSVIQNGYGDSKYENVYGHFSSSNRGVSYGWNWGLNYFFGRGAEHILVPNNDTILAPETYSRLLDYNLPFVTGREVTNLEDIDKPPIGELGGGPQFSCFLIRKDAWEKIGDFDESQWGWCSDCDYHLRAHRLGINLQSAPVLYYHERSSTIKNAPPKEKRLLGMQADADRLEFAKKWGFSVGSPQYAAQFSAETFGIDAKKEETHV